MAWTEFADKWDTTAGDSVASASFDSMEDGIQTEFVNRLATNPVNGVISGMAPTEDDTNDEIDIAAGVAYVEGKKAVGGVSVTLVGEDAGDYYIYIDPTETNEASAYKAKTTVPTSGELLLAYCTWNGTDTITNFEDLRQWGIVPMRIDAVDLATVETGLIFVGVVDRGFWIESVEIVQTDNGSSGTTIVDVHAGDAASAPATIFTTQTRRPELTHDTTDRTVGASGYPEAERKLSAGDLIEVYVDSAATGAQNLGVVIYGRYY